MCACLGKSRSCEVISEMFGQVWDLEDYLYEQAREEARKGGGDAAELAEVLLRIREQAREEKDYKLADRIRDELGAIGAEVRDSKDGAKIVWK